MTQSGTLRPIVIDGARIIDGTGNPPVPEGRVTIVGDRVVAAGPKDTVTIPEGSEVVTGTGRTVLPGLIDTHVHDFSDSNMALYVKNGVTSIRFAGGVQQLLLDLRGRIERREIPGPRVFSVGPPLDATPHAWPSSAAADSPIEARRLVRRMVEEEHVDAILATHRISRPVLAAIVETAHELGLPVTGQTWTSDARDAAAVGMDGLENTSRIPESDAYPLDRVMDYHSVSSRIAILGRMWAEANWNRTTEIAHLLAESGLALAPELVSFEAWAGLADADLKADRDWAEYGTPERELAYDRHNKYISQHWSQDDFNIMPRAIERFADFCGIFYKDGGLLVAGTDLSFSGILLHREMELFRQIGLTPLEVIRTATRQAASALGRDDLGYLAPGRLADLIVVEGDPSTDLRALRDVRYTFIGGNAVVRKGVVESGTSPAGR